MRTIVMESPVDVIGWNSNGALLQRAQSAFVSLQARALTLHLARLKHIDPLRAESIAALIERLPANRVFRVILAPEMTARLGLTTPKAIRDVGELLEQGLRTEGVAAGAGMHLDDRSWTVLGDALVSPSGTVDTPLHVEGLPPLDVASPQARHIDPATAVCADAELRHAMQSDDRTRVYELLCQARDGIAAVSSTASAMLRGCGLVIVVVTNPTCRLSSSTHGLHVGRITVAAGDWSSITAEDLADALVHEAIHCLLLMLEPALPLFEDDLAVDHLPPVPSPWTGNPLPVSTYVHACYVWFGLAHFWQRAEGVGAFDPAEVGRLYARACRGYGAGSPQDRIGERPSENAERARGRGRLGFRRSVS